MLKDFKINNWFISMAKFLSINSCMWLDAEISIILSFFHAFYNLKTK